MKRELDEVEREYEEALRYCRSDEEAYELSVGLREYRLYYKTSYKPTGEADEPADI